MARIFSLIFLSLLLLIVPSSAHAWRNVPLKERKAEKIPYRPQWVSVVKKGKLLKYKRKEFSSPVVRGDMVFVGGDGGYFYAMKKRNGDKVWRFKNAAPINSQAAVTSDLVLFGDDEGVLHALRIADGKEAWKTELGSEIISAPATSEAKAYVATAEGVVAAVSTDDGRILWQGGRKKEFSGQIRITIRGNAAPVLDGDRLFVGYSDGVLQALSAANGKVLWEKLLVSGGKDSKEGRPMPSGRFEDIDGTPLVDGDRIYASTYNGGIFALSKQNGSILWHQPQGSASAPLLLPDGETLVVAGSNGNMFAYRKKDGSLLWNSPVGKGSLTSPVSYKDLVAVGLSDETMNFLDADDGHVIARRFAKKGIFSDPVVDEDRIYYLSNGGRLYSLKLIR